jgi:hypothetical protein
VASTTNAQGGSRINKVKRLDTGFPYEVFVEIVAPGQFCVLAINEVKDLVRARLLPTSSMSP